MPKAEYRSAVRSRKMITDALADLLTQKQPDKITVSDIVRHAEINRGTFYAHYNDVPDVLNQIIRQTFSSITDVLQQTPVAMQDAPRVILTHIQTLLENDVSFYQKLMKSGVGNTVRDQLIEIVLEYLYARQQAQSTQNNEKYVLVMRFCAGGLANLYSDWLAGKLSITLDQLTDTACNLLDGVINTMI